MSQTISQFRVNTTFHRPFSNFYNFGSVLILHGDLVFTNYHVTQKIYKFLTGTSLGQASVGWSHTEPDMDKPDILRTSL